MNGDVYGNVNGAATTTTPKTGRAPRTKPMPRGSDSRFPRFPSRYPLSQGTVGGRFSFLVPGIAQGICRVCSTQSPSRSFLLRFLHLLHAIHLQWLWDLQWKLSALKFHCQPYNLSINVDTNSGSACNQSCSQVLHPIMLADIRALLVATQRVNATRNKLIKRKRLLQTMCSLSIALIC